MCVDVGEFLPSVWSSKGNTGSGFSPFIWVLGFKLSTNLHKRVFYPLNHLINSQLRSQVSLKFLILLPKPLGAGFRGIHNYPLQSFY